MVRRAYTQRSLVEVLLPDGDKLWDPALRRIDAILDDEELVDRIAEALARRRTRARMKVLYQGLMRITRAVVREAEAVVAQLPVPVGAAGAWPSACTPRSAWSGRYSPKPRPRAARGHPLPGQGRQRVHRQSSGDG